MMFQIFFFAVITMIIAYRLYSELGKKSQHDRQPSQDWQPNFPKSAQDRQTQDTLVPPPAEPTQTQVPLNDGLTKGVASIQALEPSFDLDNFLDGAKSAFAMILDAFANGDKDTLQMLQAKDVYRDFERAIDERERRGETLETSLVGFKSVTPQTIEVEGKTAFITLRFVSEQGFVLKAEDGSILDTSGAQIDEIVDIWTFARNLKTNDPNWSLIATDTEEG